MRENHVVEVERGKRFEIYPRRKSRVEVFYIRADGKLVVVTETKARKPDTMTMRLMLKEGVEPPQTGWALLGTVSEDGKAIGLFQGMTHSVFAAIREWAREKWPDSHAVTIGLQLALWGTTGEIRKVEEAAERMDTTERTLARRVGGTLAPHEWLNLGYMLAALRRFVEEDKSLVDAAFEGGYRNASHLSAQVRRMTGVPPTEIKNRTWLGRTSTDVALDLFDNERGGG